MSTPLTHKLTASERLSALKYRLFNSKPFVSYILMNMTFTPCDDVPYLAINKRGDVTYNPQGVQELTDAELEGVIYHEAGHIITLTFCREGSRDHNLWNIATDICINYEILREGTTLPDWVYRPDVQTASIKLGDDVIKVTTAEEVYDKLYNMADKISFNGDGSVTVTDRNGNKKTYKPCDEHKSDGDDTDDEDQKNGQKWKQIIAQAAEYAKARSSTGVGGWGRYVDEILTPTVDWRSALQRFMQKQIPYDFTMTRPHKLYYTSGFYLPTIVKKPNPILVAVDVSGSISNSEITDFATEIVGMLNAHSELNIHVCFWSTKVSDNIEALTRDNCMTKLLNLKFDSTGGTTIQVVDDFIKEKNLNYPSVIYLTDGYVESEFTCPKNSLFVISRNGIMTNVTGKGQVVQIK